ncbi:unnamed protein product [Oikopleura dioica]|uniref:Uncharacterized protein n=1 Tax=Oikopleura dioica TaxID=34765 RepID=E4WQ34_OIKDI|nr:unnamed protein product [Oikopleura dioica]
MEEFILGNGAAQKLEPEEVRVEGGDAVRELKRSMLEGTKNHCYQKQRPQACMTLADFYRERKQDLAAAARTITDCCERLKNASCCWEAGILKANGFEKTNVEQNFPEAVHDFKTACLAETAETIMDRQATAKSCFALSEILRRDLSLAAEGQKKMTPVVKGLLEEMNVKSLVIRGCKLGSWEACNSYAIMSFDGLFGIEKDVQFGLDLAEKSCLHGNEIKACVNLEKIYSDGFLGVENDKKREMKLESYQRKIEELSDDFELDIDRVDDLARS